MARAKIIDDGDGRFYGIGFACPGCAVGKAELGSFAGMTVLPVNWTPPGWQRSPLADAHALWDFNGDLERPTLSPSILTRATYGEQHTPYCCHSFVREGRIQFLDDCTHKFANQTVDLPELAETAPASS